MIKPLKHPDKFHLQAAQGWVELGNFLEANNELEKIATSLQAHPAVLEIRWHVYAHARKWEACLDIASALLKLFPASSDAWIHRSVSLRALKRTREVLDNLLPAAKKFPCNCTIRYNLACYGSQLGRLEEARRWFKRAMSIAKKTVQKSGIHDPDLQPLWDSMSTTLWKRTK